MIRLLVANMVMAAVVISRTVDSVGEAVVFLGAVAVALEALRRVVGKPVVALYRKADRAFDLVSSIPVRLDRLEHRLDKVDRQTGADLTVRHELHHDTHDL